MFIVAIVAALAIVGFFAMRTVKQGAESERVHVDLNKVREEMKTDKFGGH